MGDFDYLAKGVAPVAVPNPLDIATKQVTLAQLMNSQQSGALDLIAKRQMMALMSDPRYGAMMGQMFSSLLGGGSGDVPGSGAVSVNPNTNADVAALFQQYPLASADAINRQLGIVKTGAEISKDRAAAAKDYQDVRKAGVGIVGSQAMALAKQADPVTPMQDAMLVNQALHVGTPREVLVARPPLSDQAGYKQWAASLGNAATDPKAQADIWQIEQTTPANVAKTQVETWAVPQRIGIDATNAARAMQEYLRGTTSMSNAGKFVRIAPTSPTDPTPVISYPQVGATGAQGAMPSGYAGGSRATADAGRMSILQDEMARVQALPDSNPTKARDLAALQQEIVTTIGRAGQQAPSVNDGGASTAPQVDYSPIQKQMADETAKEIGDLQAKKNAAFQLQQQIVRMRDLDAQGIYSGGLWGTEGAKKMVNVLGALGYLKPEQAAKLANTQVFDAESQQVIADAVSQFAGSRIAARELPFFAGTKPTTTQIATARKLLYGELFNRAQRIIDMADQSARYVNTPDASGRMPTSLGGFSPTFRDVDLPPLSIDIGGGMTMRPSGK